jgi:hypothetical protein
MPFSQGARPTAGAATAFVDVDAVFVSENPDSNTTTTHWAPRVSNLSKSVRWVAPSFPRGNASFPSETTVLQIQFFACFHAIR